MRLRIDKIWFIVVALVLSVPSAHAQIVTANPLEWMALAEGNEAINGEIEKEIKGQTKTALLQNTIAAEFTKIHEWEKKYNSYLKTASGYASSLKACTYLYDDGVKIFITLCKMRKAINNNPQGIVATLSMNNLYMETATELVSVFTLLKDAVAKGGKENMLTGAGKEQDAVGTERQAECLQQEAASSLSVYTILHHDRCVERRDGRDDRPKQWRDSHPSP